MELDTVLTAPATTKAVIEVRSLNHVYSSTSGSVTALQDIGFSAPEGSFISIVGPSGCGKSTLLQILAGLMHPTSGEVTVDGLLLREPQPGKVAIVFQDPNLLPWKTSAENVAFPLEIQGVPKEKRHELVRSMLDLVGLRDFGGHYPSQLSGGMRQRVSIARGLAQDPRIILMDEPFGALDEQSRTKMGEELLRIWAKTHKTILLITHSITEALYLSDQVLVMSARPGRIIDRIDVPFPRPRNLDMIGSPEFGRARNHIWHLLTADDKGRERDLEAT
jgi:NitT/TauT family transport system ATP-binding protein